MRILARYVLKEFLVPFAYCLTGFLSIYVLFELSGSFSRLVDSKLPFATVVGYFFAYLSPFFKWLAPAALMLATLYTMWNFCRHSEIVAMRASGIGFFAIVRPLLAVALAVAAAVAWVNECVVPSCAQWAKRLRNEKFDEEKTAKAGNLVYRNPAAGRTWTVDEVFDRDGCRLGSVRVAVDREGGARLLNIIAKRADYLDGEWWFTDPSVQHYNSNGEEVATPTPALDSLPFRVFPQFDERPEDLMAQNRDWNFNSTRDRLRYLEQHPDLSGQLRRRYLYDTWAQIVSPFACLIITLFAVPAGISSGRQSVFKGILGALGMFFAFYALTFGCMAFADRELLPPVVAAILPDVLFLGIGVAMFRKCR